MTEPVVLEAMAHELLDHLHGQGSPALWHLVGHNGTAADPRVWILVATNDDKDEMAIEMLSHEVPRTVDICALTYMAWAVTPEEMQGFEGSPSEHPNARHVRCVFLISRDHHVVSIMEGDGLAREVNHDLPTAASAFGLAMLSLFPANEEV